MRTILLFVVMISSVAVKAQTYFPVSVMDYSRQGIFGSGIHSFGNTPDKKWSLSTYRGISTGFGFFNGGNAFMLDAPIGLQLNRRLNKNYYAFAGVSTAPGYMNFSRSFLFSDVNKMVPGNGMFGPGGFGIHSVAEMGLMYVNDARTFSVSGSISVQNNSYPGFPYQQMHTVRSNSAAPVYK